MAALKVTDLGDYLKEQRQHAKMSLRQLAEQAGVSNPYLSQIERGLRKPSAEVLQQIAKGLRISAEALYVRAGILEERGDRVEVEAAVLADPHLSERQRRVLLDIYESFRAENERDADTHVASSAPPSESSPSEPGTTGKGRARKRAAAPSEFVTPARSAAAEAEPRKSARKAAKRAARTVAGRATSAQRRAAKKSTTDSDSQSQGGN